MFVTESSNAILMGLNQAEFDALERAADDISLKRGAVIAEAAVAAPYVYFPTCGVLSLVGTTSAGATVELAVVGNEGVASVSAILGNNWLPFRVVTQVPGRALRIPTPVVTGLMMECGHFHQRLLDYTHEMIAQVAQSAICNRFHNAKQRLARWLMMTADRAESNELPLTHEFISSMVGGPRSAVTEAAAELRDAGAIDYRRGLIVIRDGIRLRQLSCECYNILQGDDGKRGDAGNGRLEPAAVTE
jgi:CRP-like cAMP-binding protein